MTQKMITIFWGKKAKYAVVYSAFAKMLIVINNKGREGFRAHLEWVFIHLNFTETDYEICINLDALSTVKSYYYM